MMIVMMRMPTLPTLWDVDRACPLPCPHHHRRHQRMLLQHPNHPPRNAPPTRHQRPLQHNQNRNNNNKLATTHQNSPATSRKRRCPLSNVMMRQWIGMRRLNGLFLKTILEGDRPNQRGLLCEKLNPNNICCCNEVVGPNNINKHRQHPMQLPRRHP